MSNDPFSIKTLNDVGGAVATIYPYGAHLSSWITSTGKSWIFLSEQAKFEEGAAIRGGVPIIFPQFNAFGSGARHGFARNRVWQLSDWSEDGCCFELVDDGQTLTDWPYPFKAEFRVKLTGDQLEMELGVTNTGSENFSFTCALHSYLSIEDLQSSSVAGLGGLAYWDNNGSDFSDRQIQDFDQLCFSGAIDRVYFSSKSSLILRDNGHSLNISTKGFSDVVVWNPGAEAAKKMDDLADSEHDKMLCIEAANIDSPIVLKPEEQWFGSQVLVDTTESV